MTTLVFGKTGQVATELGAFQGARLLGRDAADLTQPQVCAALISEIKPQAVINAAAYTAVDKAEEEEPLALQINGDAPAAMAEACAALDIPFVHISTDYVFDGSGTRAWQETDPVSPQNAYGRTKRAGEDGVRAAGGRFAIMRTSWVFSAHGANFLKTMLRLSETRDALSIVADQIGGPTPADAIAAAAMRMAETLAKTPEAAGTYHFSGAPDVSWADFARHIFATSGRDIAVSDIATTEYPTPAARPLNSRLDCSATAKMFGIDRPDWRGAVTRIVADLEG
jgi:dTDP-4-dehydrorhamnose reductase